MTDQRAQKILVIEDDESVRAGLVDGLTMEGYDVIFREDGESGVEAFLSEKPDLVILDVMMPRLNGLDVCKRIRQSENFTPIIILTAKAGEIDKVLGLELGADDYLTKPFGMRELFARIKALLRRVSSASTKDGRSEEQVKADNFEELSFSDVYIDFRTYKAVRGKSVLSLSAKEFELIKYLSKQPDVPVSRDELLDNVWGYNSYPTTRTVDNFIARLRQKLEPLPEEPRHIITVHGVGYKFVTS